MPSVIELLYHLWAGPLCWNSPLPLCNNSWITASRPSELEFPIIWRHALRAGPLVSPLGRPSQLCAGIPRLPMNMAFMVTCKDTPNFSLWCHASISCTCYLQWCVLMLAIHGRVAVVMPWSVRRAPWPDVGGLHSPQQNGSAGWHTACARLTQLWPHVYCYIARGINIPINCVAHRDMKHRDPGHEQSHRPPACFPTHQQLQGGWDDNGLSAQVSDSWLGTHWVPSHPSLTCPMRPPNPSLNLH